MSKFLASAKLLASQLPNPVLTHADRMQQDIGRQWALDVIDAARNGDRPPNILFAAFALASGGGHQDPMVLRGFVQELYEALTDPR